MRKLSVIVSFILISFSINAASIYGYEDPSFYKDEKGYSLYLSYIGLKGGVNSVYNKYPGIIDSNAKVGLYESGVYSEHKDLYVKIPYSAHKSYKKRHGTMVASTIASHIGNGEGTRGIAFLKKGLEFIRYPNDISGYSEANIIKYYVDHRKYNIMNFSKTLAPETSYRHNKGTFSMEAHVKAMMHIRKVFENHPNTLFVLSAGNQNVDSDRENGAIHYVWTDNGRSYRPLDNVIVVGSIEIPDDSSSYGDAIKTSYSSRGITVDIWAPSNVSAAYEVSDKGESLYKKEVTGTSLSVPMVTGVAALLFETDYGSSPAKIKKALTKATGLQKFAYRPLLNAYYSVDYAMKH